MFAQTEVNSNSGEYSAYSEKTKKMLEELSIGVTDEVKAQFTPSVR